MRNPYLEPRGVRVMKCDNPVCNSVRAVFVDVLFTQTVGWLDVFLSATETCPNSEKIHHSSRLGEC